MPLKVTPGLDGVPGLLLPREPIARLESPLAWNDETNLGKGVTRK